MASKYTFRGTADMTQHDQAIKKSASEIYKYQKEVKNAQQQLKSFDSSVNGSISGIKGLGDAFRSGDIGSFASSLQSLIPTLGAATAGATGLGVAINTALGPVGLITSAIAAVGAVAIGAGKSFADFEKHLDSLQALTGLDDSAIKGIGDGAIQLSKQFRSSAGDIVDSMKLIGSQAPQLLKDKDALMAVTEAANVLSEAAEIEVVEASKGVTTVMNQMGVAASEASNIINVLAASSQQGSADVAYLNKAFEKAGTQAKSAGMSYAQLAAAVETIAPKFSSADVAGSQLNSTLLALSVQANDQFKPAVVGMSQALDNLAQAELTDAQMKDLVGASNITMLKSLIEGKNQFDSYSESLVGTSTAFEQMAINQSNLDGQLAKLKNTWDALLLTIGESEIIQAALAIFNEIIAAVQDVINYLSDLVKEFEGMNTSISIIDAVKAALTLLGAAFKALVEVVAVVIAAIVRAFEQMYAKVVYIWNAIKVVFADNTIFEPIRKGCLKVIEWFKEMLGQLKKWWNDFKKWLGMNVAEVKVTTSTNGTTSSTTPTPTPTITPTITPTGSVKTPKVKASKATATKTESPKAEVGSIKALEDSLSKLNEELTNTVVSDARLQEINAEKAALEEQIKALKIRNGLETQQASKPQAKEGSLSDIQSQLQAKKAQLSLEVVGSEQFNALAKEIADLTEKERKIKVTVDQSTKTDKEISEEAIREKQEATKKYQEDLQKGISGIGDAMSNLGSAVGGVGGTVLSVFGDMANATSQLIPQVMALIAAKQGEALAAGTAGAAAMPFPANLAAIASVIATITGVFASIMSKAQAFAGGGVFNAPTSVGDYALARVNDGEMILNHRQQGHLFKLLDGAGHYQSGYNGGQVEFKLRGNELIGLMKNHNNKQSKVI